MMYPDTDRAYGTVSRFFHWSMAACFAFMLFSAALFAAEADVPGLMAYHKSVGFVLAVLLVLRLLWSAANCRRRPSAELPVRLGHAALYALMAAVPAVGLIRQYGGGRGPLQVFGVQVMQGSADKIDWMVALGSQWHGLLGWLLFALAGGHIAMAVLHQIKGERIMQRMIGR